MPFSYNTCLTRTCLATPSCEPFRLHASTNFVNVAAAKLCSCLVVDHAYLREKGEKQRARTRARTATTDMAWGLALVMLVVVGTARVWAGKRMAVLKRSPSRHAVQQLVEVAVW